MSRATAVRSERPSSRITAEEIERRREIVRRADHENLLEGQKRDPATDHIFEAFIQGEIEVRDLVPRLKEFRAASRA